MPGTTAGSTQLTWVHGNHLGVPVATLNSAGTAITPSGYSLPGYPGQSLTLADLYYNRYRDYDPTTGRYIQADPIGLAGDVNPYLYANGNPVNYIDPLGLQSTTAPMPSAPSVAWDAGIDVLIDRAKKPGRWGRAMIVGDVIGTGVAIVYYGYINPPGRKGCEDDDDGDSGGRCEAQKIEDELECNQWRIRGSVKGYAICMSTAIQRYAECRSRGMNPDAITSPLYLPSGRRGVSGPIRKKR